MTTKTTCLERLRRVADLSLNLNLSPLELDSLIRLDEFAGLDSLTLLEFIGAVEKEFGVTLGEEELQMEVLADLPVLAERLAGKC